MFTTSLFTIKPLSNLHVGSGDANYGIIDNLIQRDAITDLPNINSSSLKGALREFADASSLLNPADVRLIFGSKPKESNKDAQAGYARFFDARLLALPVRGTKTPYFMVTTPQIITAFLDECALFGITLSDSLKAELEKLITQTPQDGHALALNELGKVEELETQALKGVDAKKLSPLFDTTLALVNTKEMNELCTSLPVIARNQLENGISQNLFYEEVLPRQSLLYTFISFPNERLVDADDQAAFAKAHKHLLEALAKDRVQIGANASIGYGLCAMQQL